MSNQPNQYDTNAFKHVTTVKQYGGDRVPIPDAPAEPKRGGNKKNTRKWCKGVVGREHKDSWVYSELLWNHRRYKTVEELPLPEKDEPLSERGPDGLWIYRHHPWARKYCPVCQKQWSFADAFKLRRAGIKVLTELPQ